MAKKPPVEKPPLFLIRTAHGLTAAEPLDAELLDSIPIGSRVEVPSLKMPRNVDRLRAYWAGLNRAIKAAEVGYPSSEKLHAGLKRSLGYVTPVYDVRTGKVEYDTDSVAIGEMEESVFREFFKRAQVLFIERFGFDPWQKVGKP